MRISLLAAGLLLSASLMAQDNVKVQEQSASRPGGIRIEYEQTTEPPIKKHGKWKLYMGNTLLQQGQYEDGKQSGQWEFRNAEGYTTCTGSYRDGKMDGEWMFYYSNGEPATSIMYKNGKRHGTATGFHKGGAKAGQRTYKEGYYTGKILSWHPNGKPADERFYDDEGKQHGAQRSWFESGQLREEAYFIRGSRDSIYRLYHKNGQLLQEIQYRNGLQNVIAFKDSTGQLLDHGTIKDGNGTVKWYSTGGQLLEELSYKNSKWDGPALYYVNSKIIQEGNYREGKRTGEWKNYDTDGKLLKVTNYENGHKTGLNTEYWASSNNKKAEGQNLNGSKHGAWIGWDENEDKVYEVSYVNGQLQGDARFYYNGKLIREGRYIDNQPVGEWKSYDERGKEIKEEEYYEKKHYKNVKYPPVERPLVETDAASVDEEIYTVTSVMPEFSVDPLTFIRRAATYPEIARDLGVSGTVWVEFVIGTTGEPGDFFVVKGLELLNDASLTVVEALPNGTPGYHGGFPVPVRFTVPIKYTLK